MGWPALNWSGEAILEKIMERSQWSMDNNTKITSLPIAGLGCRTLDSTQFSSRGLGFNSLWELQILYSKRLLCKRDYACHFVGEDKGLGGPFESWGQMLRGNIGWYMKVIFGKCEAILEDGMRLGEGYQLHFYFQDCNYILYFLPIFARPKNSSSENVLKRFFFF